MARTAAADLIGTELDVAVALADGHQVRRGLPDAPGIHERWPSGNWEWIRRPSTVWEHGGPIIERERLSIDFLDGEWHAWRPADDGADARVTGSSVTGPTLLVAAMRAYVAGKLGETVDLEVLVVGVTRPN